MFTTFEASAFLKNCCSIFNNISFKQVERRRRGDEQPAAKR